MAERLATELVGLGLAGAIWPALRRNVQVRKSATSISGEKPTVTEHYRSLVAGLPSGDNRDGRSLPSGRLLLVDDVVTKGRTLLAAALRLRELCPASEVRAFALVRTMGLVGGIEHLVVPCEGEICCIGSDASRMP